MDLQRQERPTVTILSLKGKLEKERVIDLETALRHVIQERPRRLALNLKEVESMGNSTTNFFTGALIKILNAVKNYGGNLLLFGLPPYLLRDLAAEQLDHFFTILNEDEFNRTYPP